MRRKILTLACAAFVAIIACAAAIAATTYKVLGQSNPAATTATTLYTVPASTSTLVSGIYVTNQAGTNASFRVAIRPAGATLAAQHYLAFDTVVPANDTVVFPGGFTLATTDVVTVYASTTTLSFSIFGAEIQ